MIIDRIRRLVRQDMVIPKPEAKAPFRVKAWGRRRGEEALVYTVPNHKNPERPSQKGITVSEFEAAYDELVKNGKLTRTWFESRFPKCAAEGSCNFTTVGGIFVLLADAEYAKRGEYQRTPEPECNRETP